MSGLPASTEQPHRHVRVFTRDSSGSLIKKQVRGYPEPVRAKFTDALRTLRHNVSPHVAHWNFTGMARKLLPPPSPERQIVQLHSDVSNGATETQAQSEAPSVAEFSSLATLDFLPADEAIAKIKLMEQAALAAGKLQRQRGVNVAHQARHHRTEGALHGEREPDANFYTNYLHQTLERKAAYPILKGFLHKVINYFPTEETWLDGGAGTCGFMEAMIAIGRKVVGVELSDVSQTTCGALYKQGLVKQGPLNKIPYPDHAFDVVFSSEVLEHVPPNLAQKSVNELVRCAKHSVFTTISLRPSALDKPGKPPKVHLTVRPREWWEERFTKAGCVKDEEAFKLFQRYGPDGKEISPHFFPFKCNSGPTDES
eukprot:CAMPEP_0118922598 /NCGR_PEP_ID=MMETSP1169-20130426/1476_1 /TAXON_ID=36882 /ORGANISM="Pyramimonas obovata, Strain CCMP722" /LENGTH=368 /DNA_ID=CAMNT_0006863501 /DNA_START=269 /DNA_END=1375 /DNA_ORIENTATION=+